jgi:hypothetical protein
MFSLALVRLILRIKKFIYTINARKLLNLKYNLIFKRD